MHRPLNNIYIGILLIIIASYSYAVEDDADKDGIPDATDKCLAGSILPVDNYGCDCSQKRACSGDKWCCPAGAACIDHESSARCAEESDKDNVLDIGDRCLGTKQGFATDEYGCSCEQKECDDNNPCTDDQCSPASVQCTFAVDNTNTCGQNNACQEGVCIYQGYEEYYYYVYDADQEKLSIYYKHSVHVIDVVFSEPLLEDIIVIDSTSEVVDYQLQDDRKKLTVTVQGKDGTEGQTSIKTKQEPKSVSIDSRQIPKINEKLSPKSPTWLYIISIAMMFGIMLIVVFSLRRHEDVVMGTIKKEEDKIERE